MNRKIIMIMAVVAAIGTGAGLFAQDAGEAKSLIKRGLYPNFNAIQDAAGALSPEERRSVYDATELDALENGAVGAAVNFFIGYGIGSFIMKDSFGGVLGLGMDLGCLAVTVTGIVLIYSPFIEAGYGLEDISQVDMEALGARFWTGYWMLIGASVLSTVSRVIQVVRPFAYIKSYNRKLSEALLLSSIGARSADFGLALLPGTDNTLRPALSLRVSL